MAGPMSDADRRRGMRRIAAGFAAIVGISGGMTAYFSGGTAVEAGLVVVAGVLVGVVLLFLVGVR